MRTLTIDASFDLICPWCMIGKQHLTQALAQLRQTDPDVSVRVRRHGLQLLPDLPPEGLPFMDFYVVRQGSPEAVARRQAQVQAYFMHGQDIGQRHTLVELAQGMGLDMLVVPGRASPVRSHQPVPPNAPDLASRGAPHFVFNQRAAGGHARGVAPGLGHRAPSLTTERTA
jgi:predicted DsbA family dithiol-disulfide isomerase